MAVRRSAPGLCAIGQELVKGRRTGPVAGEQEGNQAVEPRVVADVGGPHAVLRTGWHARTGPVLAEQRPLLSQLVLVPVGPLQPVRGGEQERRPTAQLDGVQRLQQVGPRRIGTAEAPGAEAALLGDRRQCWLVTRRRDAIEQRPDQAVGAQLRCSVSPVSRPPVEDLAPVRRRPGLLVGDQALDVAPILLGPVEGDPADRVAHVQQRLELERNDLRPTDQDDVVWQPGRFNVGQVGP